jgi:hypothetical protein
MPELDWAVVALGSQFSQLGVAKVEIASPESSGGTSCSDKPIDLPKGCCAVAVSHYPGEELLLVGCTGGRLLLYLLLRASRSR